MFVFFDVLKRLFFFFFFTTARFVYFDFFCLTMKSLFFQSWCFFFSISKEEIRNLSSLKSCRCLQAEWWKAKSLLDRWNLPSGYVSLMESNCWSSENFLSVDPQGILLSVRREKVMKTSKCRPKEVFEFFVVLRFFSETIFFFELLQMTLTRSWWWNVASNLIAVVETEVECRARCMMRENSSKCRNVGQIF